MKKSLAGSIILGIVALLAFTGASPTNDSDTDIVYNPPSAGAPLTRIGGSSRGAGDDTPVIAFLVPESTAYTTLEQPVLYWFVSKPTALKCQISINDVTSPKATTVFEGASNGVEPGGIQKLDLGKANVRLAPGLQYQLRVALVPDASAPSKNVDAGGMITRVPLPPAVAARLEKASNIQKASILAREGFWFDALAILSKEIEEHPEDASLRQKRAKLLGQVGLKEVAAYDSKP